MGDVGEDYRAYREYKKEVIQKGGEMNFDDLSCPFLTFDEFGKSSCTIYEKRPRVCRLFGEIEHPCMKCPNNK